MVSVFTANGTDAKYIKHPVTWLRGGCWEDEYPDRLDPADPPAVGDERELVRLVMEGLFGQRPSEQEVEDALFLARTEYWLNRQQGRA